ncbi:MAG: hypothetical protein VX730_06850 [Pseudomonadota bacterium]|nr:hypothetical protein [Pseudomonadota bacterium]
MLNNLKIIPLALITTVLVGCAGNKPPLTRAEQLAENARKEAEKKVFEQEHLTRVYNGKNKREIIDAAEKVLKLSDPKDFGFSHHDNGFKARRDWDYYAVFTNERGTDNWTVNVKELSGGRVEATVEERTDRASSQPNYIYVHGVGTMSTGTTVRKTELISESSALYDLFWKRMDYILGQRSDWTTCESHKQEVKSNNKLSGKFNQLCGPLAKDLLPEELREEAKNKA